MNSAYNLSGRFSSRALTHCLLHNCSLLAAAQSPLAAAQPASAAAAQGYGRTPMCWSVCLYRALSLTTDHKPQHNKINLMNGVSLNSFSLFPFALLAVLRRKERNSALIARAAVVRSVTMRASTTALVVVLIPRGVLNSHRGRRL